MKSFRSNPSTLIFLQETAYQETLNCQIATKLRNSRTEKKSFKKLIILTKPQEVNMKIVVELLRNTKYSKTDELKKLSQLTQLLSFSHEILRVSIPLLEIFEIKI